MANPLTVAGFPDVLDPRFREITDGEYKADEDRISDFYSVKTPTQLVERWSSLTPMGLYNAFTGTISYDGPDQGYSAQTTVKEFAKGVQVERLLVEFDQFDIIESRFKLLARSARQTRQVDAAAFFVNAFSVDTDFSFAHDEGVAVCSDSHTSPRTGTSTTVGFDNLTTAALSPTALKSAYIQFRKFRDNVGQPIDGHEADVLLVPVDLRDRADEILQTMKGLDAADQNKNVLEGRYSVADWIRLTDTNNWFLLNKSLMKENLYWFDKVPAEFARVEDFDTIQAKYRGYMVYGRGYADWRFILGASVT